MASQAIDVIREEEGEGGENTTRPGPFDDERRKLLQKLEDILAVARLHYTHPVIPTLLIVLQSYAMKNVVVIVTVAIRSRILDNKPALSTLTARPLSNWNSLNSINTSLFMNSSGKPEASVSSNSYSFEMPFCPFSFTTSQRGECRVGLPGHRLMSCRIRCSNYDFSSMSLQGLNVICCLIVVRMRWPISSSRQPRLYRAPQHPSAEAAMMCMTGVM
jgi:hypothetical protein